MRRIGISSYCLAILLTTAAPVAVAIRPDEQKVIEYAKSINVRTLDRALPSQRFDVWLRLAVPQVSEITWRLSEDCDLKDTSPGPSSERPLCVRLTFHTKQKISGMALLTVGTLAGGVAGKPRLRYGMVQTAGPPLVTRTPKKLSDIPRIVNELSASRRQRKD